MEIDKNKVTMNIPNELVEQFSRGNGAILIGAGLSIGAGLPSWGDLIQHLASELEDCPEKASYLDIAQYYVISFSKNRLISRLREELETFDVKPTCVHEALINLQISPLFTTNYDNLLEKTFQDAKIRFNPVITSVDTNFWTSDHIQLVKLHGDITQPTTVVLTSEDYERYFPDHPALTRLLSTTLQTHTLLMIGYSATDFDFRSLLTQVQCEAGTYARNAFAVMFDSSKLVIRDMERRGIQVINFQDVPIEDRNKILESWLIELQEKIQKRKQIDTKKVLPKKLPKEPYKFLNWFGEEDFAIFHGRDYEIKSLKDLVETQRITILYGESGTGKTSVIRAGLIPVLSGKDMNINYLRPLVNPYHELRETLKITFGIPQSDSITPQEIIVDKLEQGKMLLIILDQFEEFFVRQGIETRREFEKTIKDILNIPDKQVHFLFSLRSDYLDRLDEFEEILGHDPLRFRIRLHNLGPANASAAIIEPARNFSIHFDPTLLERLIADLNQGWIAPPQLQIVCYSLWKDWIDRGKPEIGLTIERYFELGTTKEILANYLNRVIQELNNHKILQELSIKLTPEKAQDTVKAILKSLITSEKTKIAVSSKEITKNELVQKMAVPSAEIEFILRYLQNRRIIRHVPDSQFYELVHEIMISQIWGWVTDDEKHILDIQDILQRAITDFRRFQTLLSPEYLSLINENINNLSFNDSELELLLVSAINFNYYPNIWVNKIEPDEAINILEKLLATKKSIVFPQIASALGHTKSPKAVRLLDDLCRQDNRDIQRAAAMAMARLNIQSVVPPLYHALMREKNLYKAAPFLEALELLNNEDSIGILTIVAIQHKDIGVRERATNAVLRSGNAKSLEFFTRQINEENLSTANKLINIEDFINKDPSGMIEIYSKLNLQTKVSFIESLSKLKKKIPIELLRVMLNDSDSQVKRVTISLLEGIEDEEANNLLIDATKDNDPLICLLALSSLIKRGNTTTLETLLSFSKDEKVDVRRSVVNLLCNFENNQLATDSLIGFLNDPDEGIQDLAFKNLFSKSTNVSDVTSLINALNNGNIEIRKKVILLLGQTNNNIAINTLSKLLNDSNKDIQQLAATSLEKIGTQYANEILLKYWKYNHSFDLLLAELRNPNQKSQKLVAKLLSLLKDSRAIELLNENLHDKDRSVRYWSAITLGFMKDPRSIYELRLALKNNNVETRRLAASVLGSLDDAKATEILITNLKDKDFSVRQEVINALGKSTDPRISDTLISALNDENASIRAQITLILGQLGNIKSIDTLYSALRDENNEVRINAAKSLVKIKDPQIIENIFNSLDDQNVTIRRKAIEIIEKAVEKQTDEFLYIDLQNDDHEIAWNAVILLCIKRDPFVGEALIKGLQDNDSTIQLHAINALSINPNKKVYAAISSLLDSSNNEILKATELVLVKIGTNRAIEILENYWKKSTTLDPLNRAMNSSNPNIRLKAALILGQYKQTLSKDVFITALHNENVEVRQQAILTLGKIGDSHSLDAIIFALKDPDNEVRRLATVALYRLGDPQSISILINGLHDQDANIRKWSVEALGKINDESVILELINCLQDTENEVRWQAAISLSYFKDTLATDRIIDLLYEAVHIADIELRLCAISALDRLNNRRAYEILKEILKDKDEKIRQRVFALLKSKERMKKREILSN